MGEVYRGFDTTLERDVAVKIMHRHLMDDEANDARFMREARLLARSVHPNIVTIHEIGKVKLGRYIVMEFVEGLPLTTIVRREEIMSPERAIDFSQQVLSALQHAHNFEIIHRDIKSENILVTTQDLVKVLDFGVAKTLAKQGLTMAGDVVGTVQYMAPEQLLGEAVDTRCDIYAAGIVLYEMLTGRLPFTSDSPAAILYNQLNEDPIPPSHYNSQVKSALDDVVLKAIDKQKEERWHSADEFAEALRSVSQQTRTPQVNIDGLLDSENNLDEERQNLPGGRPVFIGRRPELKKLVSLYQKAKQGVGQTVILMGEAGVGKSTLANRFKKYAQMNGACVLYGACLYQEGMDAYLPYIDALRSFFSRDSHSLPEDKRQEMKEMVRERVPFLLEFSERFTTSFGGPIGGGPEASSDPNLNEGIYQFVKTLSEYRPVLLILDDIQWADEASLRLFHYLSRYVGKEAILMLGISRTDRYDLRKHGKPGKLLNTLARVRREGNYVQLDLEKFDKESCTMLVDKKYSPNLFTDRFYDSLFDETKGNPFFVTETLKQLQDDEVIFQDEGTWQNKDQDFSPAVPDRIEDIFLRRISGLDEQEQELLQVAAVQGYKVDASVLAKVLEEKKLKLLKDFQRIERELQIISSNEHGFQFEHPMLRDLLYNDIPAALRREYHLMIAAELQAMYGTDLGSYVGEVADHLRRGGNHSEATPFLYEAGVRAFTLNAYRESSLFFENFLDSMTESGVNLPESLNEVELHERLGVCYEETGRPEDSLAAFKTSLRLAKQADSNSAEANALLSIGRIQGKLADWDASRKSYESCLRIAKAENLAAILRRALNNLGLIYFHKGDYSTAATYFREVLEGASGEESAKAERAHALTNLGIIANIRGRHDEAMANYESALEIYETKEKCEQDQGRIYHNIGMTLMDKCEWGGAVSAFERCVKLAEDINDRPLRALAMMNLGKTLVKQNKDLEQAKSYSEKALKFFKSADDTLNVAEVYHIWGLIYSAREQYSKAEKFLKMSIDINESLAYKEGLAECYSAYAELAQNKNDSETARQYYENSLSLCTELGLKSKASEILEILDQILPETVIVVDDKISSGVKTKAGVNKR